MTSDAHPGPAESTHARGDHSEAGRDAEHGVRPPDATDDDRETSASDGHDDAKKYWRFGAMILTSMVAMHLVMYLNTYAWDHVRFSEMRLYMTLLMGATMAVVMLAFMLGMYSSRVVNAAIVVASVLVFAAGLWLVRSQALVEDQSYMRAMIPHHSIAILTSERAGIDDVRVRELADEIIAAQRREIAVMDWLIDDIATNGAAETRSEAEARPVPDFSGTANGG